MVRRGIRDPRIALVPALLWENLKSFSDGDLRAAFVACNAVRQRVHLSAESPPPRHSGIPLFIRQLFKRRG